jgi:hypothetical protein
MKKASVFAASLLIALLAAGAAFAVTFTSDEGGFSIDLPDGWQPLPDEQLAASAAGGVYLMAMDQAALQQGKSLSLNGAKSPVPAEARISAKDFAASQAEQMKAVPGLKGDVKTDVKSIGGLEWAKVAYTVESSGVTVAVAQYSAFDGESLYSFIYTVDDLSAREADIEKSMATFKKK